MKKIVIAMNFFSLSFLFAVMYKIIIPSPGITGFATAVPNASFEFQPFIILAFLFILTTLILNTYFFLKNWS